MTVAAVEYGSGPVIRQVEVGSRSNGLPAVRDYARRVGIAGCAVALDVTHTQHETALSLLDCGADRVLAAVKENRKGVLAGLKAIGFNGAPAHVAVDDGRGRVEPRHCAVVDLSGPEHRRAHGPPRVPSGHAHQARDPVRQ